MLSMDVALHLPDLVGGVGVFSGVLFTKNEWAKLVDTKTQLKVLLCHGTKDTMLPYEAGVSLKNFLEKHKVVNTQFVSFNGPHTIAPECLNALANFVPSLIKKD